MGWRSDRAPTRTLRCVREPSQTISGPRRPLGFSVHSALERLHVGTNHFRDAADFRCGPQFMNGSLLEPSRFFQRLDGDIESNLVAELKAIGDGLGRSKDADGPARDVMLGRSELKCSAGHADESNWWRRDFGSPGLVADGNPNFTRRLGGEVVKSECREQTNNAFGGPIRCFDKRCVFVGRKCR